MTETLEEIPPNLSLKDICYGASRALSLIITGETPNGDSKHLEALANRITLFANDPSSEELPMRPYLKAVREIRRSYPTTSEEFEAFSRMTASFLRRAPYDRLPLQALRDLSRFCVNLGENIEDQSRIEDARKY